MIPRMPNLDGLVRMMSSANDLGSPVNLGDPDEYIVLEQAEKIIAITGPRLRRPDIGLAHSRLGWQPVAGLEEGLTRTIAYYDEPLKSGNKARL